MGESKAGSFAVEAECFDSRAVEESEMEFEAAFTKSIFDLVIGDGYDKNPLYAVTVLERLENGDCEGLKMDKPAVGASIPSLDLPDCLIYKNGTESPLDTVTVQSHLENGDCGEPKMEDARNGDCMEELVVDSALESGKGLMQIPLDEDSHMLPKKVQDISENDFENNGPKSGLIYDGDENVARDEEHHLDEATPCSFEVESEHLRSDKDLPSEAGKNVIQLQCESSAPGAPNGLCNVNIIGTAHVSKASCEEVKALIRHVKPEVVFLELCSSRTGILFPSELEVPSLSSMLTSFRKKEMNLFGLVYVWFLSKAGEKMEIHPGTEFRMAYEEAVKCGAYVSLGDRPIQVTLKRTWGMMSTWHKIKLIFCLLTATFNLPSADDFQALMAKMEQSDELTLMIQELSKTFPTLSQTLVVERDLYMVASLNVIASRYSSVVAVVGRGHLSGIAKHWKEDINVEELLTIPAKNSITRKWFWSALALGVGGIAVSVHLLRHK